MAVPLLSMAMSSPAWSQSRVTLAGVIDEGLNYTNNAFGNPAWQMQSGDVQSSIFTLSGVEDLGGGTKATFTLKTAFSVNNGARVPGRYFVGLANDRYGALTLGRQYDSIVDFLSLTTAAGNWGGTLFAHPLDADNTNSSFHINNAAKYMSPDFGGFQFSATYSFSNDTSFLYNRQYSFGAQYNHGPLLIAAGYLQANQPGEGVNGTTPPADASFGADLVRIAGAGINYQLGHATLGFVYTYTRVQHPVYSGWLFDQSGNLLPISPPGETLNALNYQNFELNGSYQFTPGFSLGASLTYTLMDYEASTGTQKPKVVTAGVMADYFLSKRTDVYFQSVFQHVGGDQTGSLLDHAYVLGAAGVSTTANQVVVRVAMRHRF
ncbi:porin [Paraburkholderia unamae]|uniref:porin n=1 Tax=Paraburkholderia unamae TaxID=219649 RepID=UPI0015EB52C2|nr:porin [Paraburkholderia unamae]